MLGGLSPVIIFQLKEVVQDEGFLDFDIPVVSDVENFIESQPIPVYLDPDLTGIFIDTEDKNVDIETNFTTKNSGGEHEVDQRGINSSVSINMIANRDSIGLILLSSLIDKVFNKVTSNEYAVSYLNGATTIFRGKIDSCQVKQNASDNKLSIQLIISIGEKAPKVVNGVPTVPRDSSSEVALKSAG